MSYPVVNFVVQARVYHEEQPRIVQIELQVPPNAVFDPSELDQLLSDASSLDTVLQQSFDEDEVQKPKLSLSQLNEIAPRQRFSKFTHHSKTCAICQQIFKAPRYVRTLPCHGKHIYCSGCIEKWVTQYSADCPSCRTSLQNQS